MTRPAIAGLILSGGASRRMGRPKALLTIEGETFIGRLISTLAFECEPVIVVLGHGAEQIRAGMGRAGDVQFAINSDPERGMLSSLQCGLQEIPAHCAAALFTPVDYPRVASSTVSALARAFAEHRATVTIPTYLGKRGHPVCIDREVASEILALPIQAQARDVIRRRRDRTWFVDVDDAGIVSDIDEPADYASMLAAMEWR